MTQPNSSPHVADLLGRVREGDRGAMNELFPLVYRELRRVARRRRQGGPSNETLNTTALVHEVFVRMATTSANEWQNRVHFFAVAARAMRQILTDHARRKTAAKRGGAEVPLSLDEELVPAVHREAVWVLDLDRALDQLEALSPRLARVVEFRYYGGMTDEEIASALGITDRTVRRDWVKARALLARQLDPNSEVLASSEVI
ncbi:MAG: sigma-70 family RNA polymerase sigma factor [Thermoanaerobaculia bacterium]|nr:sigma-70 family RNA polymerase sigma factor [Thermoanaerobaculia bacterium]